MRSQTPIQQQRTTQTQLSRGRPHNPSITRRIQPPRQRTRRKGKSTPLPEKRKRTRQTTHRRHANTTHRHMVNHPPPFQQQKKRRTVKKGGGRREEKRRESKQQGETQWCSGITCVLAGLRAHYPEHQQQERQRKKRRKDREKRKTNEETTHPFCTPPPFHKTAQQDNTHITLKHTPPSRFPHTTQQHSNTKRKRATRHEGMQRKGGPDNAGAGSNSKTGNTVKMTGAT